MKYTLLLLIVIVGYIVGRFIFELISEAWLKHRQKMCDHDFEIISFFDTGLEVYQCKKCGRQESIPKEKKEGSGTS